MSVANTVSSPDGSYVLRVSLMYPTGDGGVAETAVVGDLLTLGVGPEDGTKIAQGRVRISERGTIYRLDLPNPATTEPSPLPELRPVRIVFAIVTDGQENSSREFRKEQIEAMIKEKQDQLGWQFVFLSADLGAIREAIHTGVDADRAMAYDKNAKGTALAWASLSDKLSRYRDGSAPDVSFDDEDRRQQESERKRKH